MRIMVELELESPDYEGAAFLKEVSELVKDIDDGKDETFLVSFKMHQKGCKIGYDSRDLWIGPSKKLQAKLDKKKTGGNFLPGLKRAIATQGCD